MKRLSLLLLILIFTAALTFSFDFGLFLDQKIEAENDIFEYTPSIAPWFLWNGDNGMSVYLSCLFSLRYGNYTEELQQDSGWMFIPEVTGFAFSYRINNGMYIEAGRIDYSDILGLAAFGLFDGVRFKTITGIGSISAGAFYSGLLYRETAKILMTENDSDEYYKSNGLDNYFASKRALVSLRWDLPVGKTGDVSAEVLAQFDLNGAESVLNSQYAIVQYELEHANMIRITAGALFEAMQNEDGDFHGAFGALAQARINLPTAVNDQLGVRVKYTSGFFNDTWTGFIPISSTPKNMVFTGSVSGLAAITLDYEIRILKSLFAQCAFNYFIRAEDTGSKDGNMYGGDLRASFVFQPFGDIRAGLGAGAFFPGFGNVYPKDSAVQWKVIASLTLSF